MLILVQYLKMLHVGEEELPGRKVTNKFRAYIINYVESNTKHQLPKFL